jgi:hypothetical protein
MKKGHIKLTTSEISVLWVTYMQNTAQRCFYKHFIQHIQDAEIKSIIKEVLTLIEGNTKQIKKIFLEENFPIPQGFSDEDVDLSAPALYTDLFALSFVYRGGQVVLPFYANCLTKVTRLDIYTLFSGRLFSETKLHKKALHLMLSKGLNDRPPKMEYPESVEFIGHEPSLISTWLGDKRPSDTLEIAEIFTGLERNAIGLNFIMGLIQVTKDKKLKDYLLKGKMLAEKQIDTFDKLLKENDHFTGFPTTMEVTNSTVSPFSEKLIMNFIVSTNEMAVSTLGYSLAFSMRKDIAADFSLFIADIMKYGSEGLKLLIERGWMEKPPQPIDRQDFYKT